MNEYEALQRMFKNSEYNPTKFICKDCDEIVFWGDSHCRKCDRLIVWNLIIKEANSFTVKV